MTSKLVRVIIFNSAVFVLSIFYGIGILLRILLLWFFSKSGTVFNVKKRPVPPECLNDPELGEHSYIQLKYVKLHYVEKGDRNKPLMLLLHGFPEFWYSWRHQIREFSKDYWVVAVDLRGYGDSEKPEGIHFYKLKYLIDDVKNLVEAFDREKVTVVGHDWGGAIAWYFVLIYPKMVETYVILNAPHPVAFRKLIESSFAQFKMIWYMIFFQLPYLPEIMLRVQDLKFLNVVFKSKKKPSPFTEGDRESFRFTFGKPGATTPPLNYYRANLRPSGELSKRLSKEPLPDGLLIFGSDDVALHIDNVAKSKEQVPNLTTEIIQDASHFVQQDDPESVNRIMRDFFTKLKNKENSS